jgi:prepilin-type N-terminal cleavage/methylation domain-containing protein
MYTLTILFRRNIHLRHHKNLYAFTLSELLVSLSIIALIAAFAIPKVLNAVEEKSHKAAAKEAISMIGAAHSAWLADHGGTLGSTTTATDLATKMNYVKSEVWGSGNPTMLTLHSGATISFQPNDSFRGANPGPGTEGVVRFNVDPDGGRTAIPPPSPGAVSVNLGYDGRIWYHDDNYSVGFPTTTSLNPATVAANTAGGFQGEISVAQPSEVDGFYTTWVKN